MFETGSGTSRIAFDVPRTPVWVDVDSPLEHNMNGVMFSGFYVNHESCKQNCVEQATCLSIHYCDVGSGARYECWWATGFDPVGEPASCADVKNSYLVPTPDVTVGQPGLDWVKPAPNQL